MKRGYVEEALKKLEDLEKELKKKPPILTPDYSKPNLNPVSVDNNKKIRDIISLEDILKKYATDAITPPANILDNWEKLLKTRPRASYTLVDAANQFGKLFGESDPELTVGLWGEFSTESDSITHEIAFKKDHDAYKGKMEGLLHSELYVPDSIKEARKKLQGYVHYDKDTVITIATPDDVARRASQADHPFTSVMEYQGPAAAAKVVEGAVYKSGNKEAVAVVEGIKTVGTSIGNTVYDIAGKDSKLSFIERMWLFITHPLGVLGVAISHKDLGKYLDSIESSDMFYDPLGIGEFSTDVLFNTKFGIVILIVGGVITTYFVKTTLKPILNDLFK